MSKTAWAIVVIVIIVFGGLFLIANRGRRAPSRESPLVEPRTEETPTVAQPEESKPSSEKTFTTAELNGVSGSFKFTAEIPNGWAVEYVKATDAINFYDPAVAGASNLERSQIFIRNFRASDFLTLPTVTIHSRQELPVAGHPAVRYEIEKKPGVADFPNQPSWRSRRHIVTDIRTSAASPAIFYVIAQRPELDQSIYENFLDSLQSGKDTVLDFPIEGLKDRITKKPFGLYVEPDNSPVKPERFTGFHTGVDVEYGDKLGQRINVVAITKGTVVQAARAAGYGGVVAIRQTIDGSPRLVIYGHLAPSELPKAGNEVGRGQVIGRLGEPGEETDQERKHLHFAVRKDDTLDLRGYAPNTLELQNWLDPLTLYS